MTALRRTLLIASVVALSMLPVATSFAQSGGQKIRAQNVQAQQGAKRSFELDLSKVTNKHPQSQRTAGAVQKEWQKNHRVRQNHKTRGKKPATRDQKNYGGLNR